MNAVSRLLRVPGTLRGSAYRLISSRTSTEERYWNDRVQLAGTYQIIADLGLNEGICNHLTLMSRLPSSPEGCSVMLVAPYGLLWSEVCASDLLAIDANDQVVDGRGKADKTALSLHREIHKARPDADAVFHTHMPYTTALAALKDPRLKACHQNSFRFVHDIAYDLAFGGYVNSDDEGRRIALQLGNKPCMIMQAHGSVVTGPTLAHAFDRLYYLERACMFQMLALATGQPLVEVPDEVLDKARPFWECEDEYVGLHFEAHLRRLRNTNPNFQN